MSDETQAAAEQLERELIAANKVLLRNLAFRDQVIVWIDAGSEKQQEYEDLLATMMARKAMSVYLRPHT